MANPIPGPSIPYRGVGSSAGACSQRTLSGRVKRNVSGARRLGRWAAFDAGHGVIGQHELRALGNSSLCQVAVRRTAIGGPAIAVLTDLPASPSAQSPGQIPHQIVDRTEIVNEQREAQPEADEPLQSLIERRLREASVIVLPNRSTSYRALTRAIDIVGAALLLGLAVPVMLVLAALIRLDSKGPAIFCQRRITRGGRTFTFYKFRTMYTDARERFPQLYDYDFNDRDFESSYYKMADDPRNTRVGRWLRRTTLDELPNLLNVLKGDLSLVGPRPDLPELVRFYSPEHLPCLFTKAGLTGLAQVAGRSLLSVRERLTLDTRYVANQTVLLDLRILLRTVVIVFTGRGAF